MNLQLQHTHFMYVLAFVDSLAHSHIETTPFLRPCWANLPLLLPQDISANQHKVGSNAKGQ